MGRDKGKRQAEKGRLPPFVPLLKETLDTPAWRAMSHGAQMLYVALKRRYNLNSHNNGRIFLSQRDAMKELRSDTKEISRWYRELQHFGFIVMQTLGCLGVEGTGHAPRWRLTELGCMHDPPARDFLRWAGTPFAKKTKSRRGFPPRSVGEFPYDGVGEFPHILSIPLMFASGAVCRRMDNEQWTSE